jgi:hypothetical protein
MRATITIKMDNAAFVENGDRGGIELAKILHRLADKVDGNISIGGADSIRDSNGNIVGELKIRGKR